MLDKKQQLCVVSGERNSEILCHVLLPKPTRQGSDGGTSGRVMAFCLGRPGSNPRLVFGFFQFRFAVNLLLLGVGVF